MAPNKRSNVLRHALFSGLKKSARRSERPWGSLPGQPKAMSVVALSRPLDRPFRRLLLTQSGRRHVALVRPPTARILR